jgi:hypothetical protein
MGYFKPSPGRECTGYLGLQIKISLEKPTAVPFADCPAVEMRVGVNANMETTGKSNWTLNL